MKHVVYKVIILTIIIMMSCENKANKNNNPLVINLINQYEDHTNWSYCEEWNKWLLNAEGFDVTKAYDSYESYLEEELNEVLLNEQQNTIFIINHGTGGGQSRKQYHYLGKKEQSDYILMIDTTEDPMETEQEKYMISVTNGNVKKEHLSFEWDKAFFGVSVMTKLVDYKVTTLFSFNPEKQVLSGKLHFNVLDGQFKTAESIDEIKELLDSKTTQEIKYKWTGRFFE